MNSFIHMTFYNLSHIKIMHQFKKIYIFSWRTAVMHICVYSMVFPNLYIMFNNQLIVIGMSTSSGKHICFVSGALEVLFTSYFEVIQLIVVGHVIVMCSGLLGGCSLLTFIRPASVLLTPHTLLRD